MPPFLQFIKRARLRVLSVCCLAGGFLGTGTTASAQPETFGGNPDSYRFIRVPSDTDDWTRHFRLGALVGMNISARFSENGTFNSAPNGIYSDGYVLPDQTGDSAYTSNWGYDNRAAQYNAADQTLQMHGATSYSTTGSGNADGGFSPGIELAYGDNLWYWKHARVGWEFGFAWLPVSISQNSAMPATVTQSTFTFSTANLGPGFPTASSYQGGSSGTGYLLPLAYAQTSTNLNGTVSSSQSLDVSLFTMRLGPSFYWDLTDKIGMSLGAGPAVGIMSGDYKYNETITAASYSSHNAGQISGTDFIYGGYVSAAVMYHVQNDADIYAGVQYMPMSDATISGGGREGRLKLGGQLYFSIGINWPF